MTIQLDLGLQALAVYKTTKTATLPVTGTDPDVVYGVELEIENMGHLARYEDACVSGMQYHEDGSLRNNGAEYVTQPMKMRELAYTLDQFFKKNKLSDANYSERCSVHVHTNVLDLSWEQLKTLVLTYIVFERCLFGFIGNERDKNIFCVPLYDTTMVKRLLAGDNKSGTVYNKLGKWEKYTALNFLPIRKQGSIEWRHMAGTNDLNFILTWCNIIGQIFQFAKKNSFDDAMKFYTTLNTSSLYNEAVSQVFGGYSGVLLNAPNYDHNIEEGVLVAKYALMKELTADKWFERAQEMQAFIINPVVEQADAPLRNDNDGGVHLPNRQQLGWGESFEQVRQTLVRNFPDRQFVPRTWVGTMFPPPGYGQMVAGSLVKISPAGTHADNVVRIAFFWI